MNEKTKKRSHTIGDFGWTNVDYVTSNAKLCCFDALLHIFADNESVIKMILSKAEGDDETRVLNAQSCARLAIR